MRILLFILTMAAALPNLSAQVQSEPDQGIFTGWVQITPQPEKAIKGWNYKTDYEYLPGKTDTVLVGHYPGKILKFQFRGNAAGIACYTGSAAGVLEYSIDEADWEEIDLFTAGEAQLCRFRLESTLKNRKHTLQVRVARDQHASSTGTACAIRSFYYNAE